MRHGAKVRTRGPVWVWVTAEVVLDGVYLVERVRGGDVRIAGVWVPSWCLEVCK